jgi:hypothetical protein
MTPTPLPPRRARHRPTRFVAAIVLVAVLGECPQKARAGDGEPEAAVTIDVIGPVTQGETLLALFRGARAPHPAAALAAWKTATGGRASLGKPAEAAIAALNPGMVRELAGLDGAHVEVGFARGSGRAWWRATVPNDDGSLAALVQAVALTDGACEEPIEGAPVVRVGAEGSPVSATSDRRLALASTRDGLRIALDRLMAAPARPAGPSSLRGRLDPAGLRTATSLPARRLSAWLDATGCMSAEATASLDDDTLNLAVAARLPAARGGPSDLRLDPAWLDFIPAAGILAAASTVLDTSGPALDATFATLDRVEKADPARASVAPLRVRLNLIAAAAKVRPEVDLWPKLRGATAAVLVDDGGEVSGAILVLHATRPDAAQRLARDVLPRLTASLTRDRGPDAPLGRLQGRVLRADTRGSDVVIGWGEPALPAALDAVGAPTHSAARLLRVNWGEVPPLRSGAVWPGRLRAIAAPGTALARALAEAPPIVWTSEAGPTGPLDRVRWTGLRGVVQRWLDALPLEPPSDR